MSSIAISARHDLRMNEAEFDARTEQVVSEFLTKLTNAGYSRYAIDREEKLMRAECARSKVAWVRKQAEITVLAQRRFDAECAAVLGRAA